MQQERLGIESLHDPQVCTIITVRVRLSVQFSFHTFFLAPDTDKLRSPHLCKPRVLSPLRFLRNEVDLVPLAS